MADTGNSIATTMTFTNSSPNVENIPYPIDADDLVEFVFLDNGESITVSQAQNWIDNRVRDCSGKTGTNCDDCFVCDEPTELNEFYRVSNVNNVKSTNRISIVNGVKVCRSSIIY